MKAQLIDALEKILLYNKFPRLEIILQLPKNPKHGDFSTNIAMKLSGQINKSPIEIATLMKNSLEERFNDLIKSVDIAGPGFINIFINDNIITEQLKIVLNEEDKFGRNNHGKGKKAQVEFVSANPTGPLTIGHGRGAILGDVISNILSWNGYKVEREYYYNNAGKQMTRLGQSVRARYLELLDEKIEFPDQGYEGEYIKDIAKILLEEKQDSLKNINDITPFIEVAEKNIFINIKATLEKLGLNFNNYFNENSLYESGAIENVVKSLKSKKLVYIKDGATWFKGSSVGCKQDRVIIKSTGEPTYRLPDIAYHLNKFSRDYELIVDVLGADHMDAYPDVLSAIQQLDCDIDKMKVVIHQFVTLTQDGEPVKMSTRKAQFITLDELIQEVGKDVVRYFFIMRGNNSHLNFDMTIAKEESDENPVYYLQYAHARLSNILKHAESQEIKINKKIDLSYLKLQSELSLIKTIMEFPNIIKKSHENLEPQFIANYLQKLATSFHKYYSKERVITDNIDITNARLLLVSSIKTVLFNGLQILGISSPERM